MASAAINWTLKINKAAGWPLSKVHNMENIQDHIESITRVTTSDAQNFRNNMLKINDVHFAAVDAFVTDLIEFSQKKGNVAYPRIDGIIKKIESCERIYVDHKKSAASTEIKISHTHALAELSSIKARIYQVRFLTIRKSEERQFLDKTKKIKPKKTQMKNKHKQSLTDSAQIMN